MTIPTSSTTVSRWVGNGITVQFDYDFKISAESELLVQITNADGTTVVTQVLNVDYTVSGVGVSSGGQITLTTALTNLYWVVLSDNVGYSQDVPFGNQSNFFAENHESAFDKLTRLALRLKSGLDRALRLSDTDPATDMELPAASARADKFLAFGSAGEVQLSTSIGGTAINQSVVGGFLWPTTQAETNAAVVPTYHYYEPGDVRRYGAVGTGLSSGDDYTAFNNAIKQNEDSDPSAAPIKSWSQDYYIGTGLVWCSAAQNHKSWEATGTTLVTDQQIDLLTVGPTGIDNQSFNLTIGPLLVAETTLAAGVHTKRGFLMQHLYSGEFHLGGKYCGTVIECTANTTSGHVYNQYHLAEIRNSTTGILLKPVGTGWVNENTFYGGRFGVGAGTWQWYIDMRDTTSGGASHGKPNNNAFMRPSLEAGATATMEGYYRDGGHSNLLFYPRLENTATINEALVWLDEESFAACVFGGIYSRAGDESANATIVDSGTENRIFAADKLKHVDRRGGAATTLLDLYRVSANTATPPVPVAEIRDMYSGSGTHQVLKLWLRRQGEVGSYALEAVHGGDLAKSSDGWTYECINDHTSNASASHDPDGEPGVCPNWATNWKRMPARDNSPGQPQTSLGVSVWAVSTGYEAEEARFRVTPYGHIHVGGDNTTFPKIMSGTGAPGSTAAPRGSLYMRTDSPGAGTTLYAKHGAGDSDWDALN